MSLSGKKILVGVTASIAAYKTILLTRLLVKAGAEVKIIMTPAAENFVSRLVLSTLSKNPVVSALATDGSWSNHVMLGRWADVFIVAPLSCNTLAKMATGLCDNMLLATYLSATCPIVVAPAMDEDMWYHETTSKNLSFLSRHGKHILKVASGELASGLNGMGRMMEPEDIISWVETFFGQQLLLVGKKVLITAGPTYEPIDPVRFIGNHSSGLMGIEIARACSQLGAQVTLVLGPTSLPVSDNVVTIKVNTAEEMFAVCQQHFGANDIAIMTAAVADYRPENVASEKIKKDDSEFTIRMVRNPDILAWAGAQKRANQLVVGFALETENEVANAKAKLDKKSADLIVLNSLRDVEAGFGKQTNKVSLITPSNVVEWPTNSKAVIADQLAKYIAEMPSKEHVNTAHSA